MTKQEFVKAVKTQAGEVGEMLTQKDAEIMVDAVFAAIVEELKTGGPKAEVGVYGFGTFKKGYREGRTGTAPKTGKPYTTEGKKVVKFHAAAGLKREINE